MADVKVSDINALRYFSSQAERHINSVFNASQHILHQLLDNLEDSKRAVRRINEDLEEMKVLYEEEDDYAPIAAREKDLREAKEALSNLQSVYCQLLDIIHNGTTSLTSLTNDATGLVNRYIAYLISLK